MISCDFMPGRASGEESMYAIVEEVGSRQHKVKVGDSVFLERLDVEIGSQFEFEKVLAVGDGAKMQFGAPHLASCKVVAEVVDHDRGKKVTKIYFRRRKHSMKKQGHRQEYTEIKILDIKA